MRRSIFWTIFSFSILTIISILAFVFNFSSAGLSGKTEQWGHFGDYIGGITNTLVSIANLFVLIYITIWLKKADDERNSFNLRELARPYPDFQFIKNDNIIEIVVKNSGMGPLVLQDLFYSNKEKKGIQIQDMILNKTIIKEIHFTEIIDNRWAISKDDSVTILKMEFLNSNSLISGNQIQAQIDFMNSMSVTISYTDIYHELNLNMTDKIKFMNGLLS